LFVSIEYLDACDPILITEVNLPPGPVGRVALVRVGAHAAPATVFLYPVHCLVWRAIFEHTRVLVCWFPKCNIWPCSIQTLFMPFCFIKGVDGCCILARSCNIAIKIRLKINRKRKNENNKRFVHNNHRSTGCAPWIR